MTDPLGKLHYIGGALHNHGKDARCSERVVGECIAVAAEYAALHRLRQMGYDVVPAAGVTVGDAGLLGALEREFWASEQRWAKGGSGQTSAQQTGASMVWAWLRSRPDAVMAVRAEHDAMAAAFGYSPDPMLGTVRDGRHPDHYCEQEPCPHIPAAPPPPRIDPDKALQDAGTVFLREWDRTEADRWGERVSEAIGTLRDALAADEGSAT